MRAQAFFLMCLSVAGAGAQQAPAAQKIPIRQVAAPEAVSSERLKSVGGLVQFADGHVLVNDYGGKRLVLFDSSLARHVVTADSTGSGPALYPNAFLISSLFYYGGDSAAFTDMSTQAFIIIGHDGKQGRSMAHPRTTDMRVMSMPYRGHPDFDPHGRFIYRGVQYLSERSRGTRADSSPRTIDTAAIVRADFESRVVDTIATIELPVVPRPMITRDNNGRPSAKMIINPVPQTPDDWAVLSDGSLAIVRPHDYHIDWVHADGTKESTPKMPFDWRRLTDADKQAKVDSIKHIIDSVNTSGKIYGMIITFNAGRQDTIKPKIEFVPNEQMLDYVPAIRNGALQTDRDNHLWILPSTTLSATGGGLLYDVVNTKGELFERVQLPAGRAIAGFGPGGVIYMTRGDRTTGITIERTRVIRP